jgi:protein ImuB
MLWLCLLLPRLPLDLMTRAGVPPALPQAAWDGAGARRWLVQANDPAEALGVRAGQSVAAARALCAGLELCQRNAKAEAAALERLAASCYRLSGTVQVAPDAVLLEAGASFMLFGGAAALLAEADATCAELGLTVRMSLAPTPAAAELLARAGADLHVTEPADLHRTLGQFALAHTPLSEETRHGLARVGFDTVGDLARLPRAALARRFRAETVAYLDRLFGHAPDPRPAWQPPARFASRIELPAHFHALEPLLFPLRRLVSELCACLAAREGGVQRFKLLLRHEQGPPTWVRVGSAEPTRDPARLFELARARLERTTLPAPVAVLGLLAPSLPPLVPRDEDLFRREQSMPLPRLLERLCARLGDGAVAALTAHPDHRPERASLMDTAGLALAEAPAGYVAARAARVEHLGTRPVWLLPAPAPIDPAQFELLAGPERLESGWWDGADVSRDYYLAGRRGAIGWIFHERRPPRQWYLHGWFG